VPDDHHQDNQRARRRDPAHDATDPSAGAGKAVGYHGQPSGSSSPWPSSSS